MIDSRPLQERLAREREERLREKAWQLQRRKADREAQERLKLAVQVKGRAGGVQDDMVLRGVWGSSYRSLGL
jgi:hypothetical protein